ncbi:MAG: YceI family protein [Anaerolineales bacterium]|nr:YceI family protein [Anaerolineales bacterium]
MSSTGRIVVGVVAVVVLIVGGFLIYDAVLGETEEASGPITAAPIELETPVEDPYPIAEAEASVAESSNPYPVETESPAETEAVAASGPVVFSIIPEQSEARFELGEILQGQPKQVIGATDQVAGELAVDVNDLASAQVGEIVVNARTLATDSDRRDRAIRNQILVTDTFEFVTFTPTAIGGLTGSAAVGDEFTFQVTGDLMIRDVSMEVVFDVSAALISEDRIAGSATAVIERADYNLVIPSVPSVAGVDEQVVIEIDFVAEVK